MFDFLTIPVFLFILLFFHETGHIVAAKILGLQLQKVGFTFRPYPHVFVAVVWTHENIKRYVYLFSGIATTIMLFLVAFLFNLFEFRYILYTFIIQFVLETNPFYSDFVIAKVTDKIEKSGVHQAKNSYQKTLHEYLFSWQWYIHFFLWMGFIFLLLKSFL